MIQLETYKSACGYGKQNIYLWVSRVVLSFKMGENNNKYISEIIIKLKLN